MIYADSSALIAWFHPRDKFSLQVVPWLRERGPELAWNLALRLELRHHLRRVTSNYRETAWHAYRAAETTGRLLLDRASLAVLFEEADELSARHHRTSCGSWDCLHVAAGLRSRVEWFATADSHQATLARAAGLQVKLFS